MAKIDVPFLVAKRRGAKTHWYWQPSATLKAAKWTPLSLGTDATAAMLAAQARNREVAAWRSGGAAPRTVKRHVAAATVGALVTRYRKEVLPGHAASTQHTYGVCLTSIERWAADAPLTAITRLRVQTFGKELAKPARPGGKPRSTRAAGTIRVLRTLFQFAVDNDLLAENPALKPGIAAPPPRDQIWPDHCIDAMVAAADRLEVPSYGAATKWGCPSLATAVMLAAFIGQREGDVLKLTWSQWRDGRLRLRQGKTKRWIEVMALPELAARLDALHTANRALVVPHTHILLRETDGTPYTEAYFQREFRRLKAAAIAGYDPNAASPDDRFSAGKPLPGCADLADLQYRDLRRTAVVRLAEADVDLPGIAAISGHQIESCKRILETYLPRTTKMADAAILKWGAHRAKARGEVTDSGGQEQQG